MCRWLCAILLILFIGCKSIKPISPTLQELNIPENFNNYIFSDTNSSLIRTIRISIHVIQDSLGHGNFTLTDSLGDHTPEWYWLNGLVEDASKRMANLQPMHMPIASDYVKDSRIRYKVVGIYDWQNQDLFNLSKVSPFTGNRMHQFILNEEEVIHKENSLHLFLAGSTNKDNGKISSRGIASGRPDKRWSVLFNYYNQYKRKSNYWPSSLISHEIGHNLGLSHTWNRDDGCDDTPQKSKQCWALNEPRSKECDELTECSNNLMDYNAWQNALTECQLATIHYHIQNNSGNLLDVIESSNSIVSSFNGSIEGDNKIDSLATYQLINAPAGHPVKWYVTPRDAVTNPIGTGSIAAIRPSSNYSGKCVISFETVFNKDTLSLVKPFRITGKTVR